MIHLGLTPAEIGRLTPRILAAFWTEHANREKIAEYRFAKTPWILAEINRDRKARPNPFTIEDFMPGSKERKRITTPEEAVLAFQQSSEEALNEMLNFTAVHNANLKQRGKA